MSYANCAKPQKCFKCHKRIKAFGFFEVSRYNKPMHPLCFYKDNGNRWWYIL